MAGVALVLAVSGGAGATEPGTSAGWRRRLDLGVGELVSPGALALAHAHLEGLAACAQCHDPLGGTPDGDCLACHEDVGARMAQKLGVHGGFEGECADCHIEHRGRAADLLGLDRGAFNHERARFALRGAHVSVECDACHLRADVETGREGFHSIGMAFERCSDCHRDPHGDSFLGPRDCHVCHGEAAFSEAALRLASASDPEGFRHGRDTAFALEGRHSPVACASCHLPEQREAERVQELPPGRGADEACVSCHDDIHQGALGSDCARCHTADAWKGPGAVFDHARHTDSPLDPLHAGLPCTACHQDARFRSASRACEGCHADAAVLLAGRFEDAQADPDPHAERVTCRGCHPEALTGTKLLDYERTCAACHAPSYGTLLATRKRLLDEQVVRSEAAMRRVELARRRGERSGPRDEERAAEWIRRLARSGAHNMDLAEALLREELARLEGDGPASGSR